MIWRPRKRSKVQSTRAELRCDRWYDRQNHQCQTTSGIQKKLRNTNRGAYTSIQGIVSLWGTHHAPHRYVTWRPKRQNKGRQHTTKSWKKKLLNLNWKTRTNVSKSQYCIQVIKIFFVTDIQNSTFPTQYSFQTSVYQWFSRTKKWTTDHFAEEWN